MDILIIIILVLLVSIIMLKPHYDQTCQPPDLAHQLIKVALQVNAQGLGDQPKTQLSVTGARLGR